MINKNIIYKIMCSLIILLIIFMPNRTFAGTYNVKSWEEYREKVQEDIKKQEENIIINFSKDLIFTSEYSARNKVEIELGNIKKSLPKYLGELNIVNIQTAVELKTSTNSPLKSVTHKIDYKTSKDNILALNGILNEKYKEIKFKATDYEKIEEVYKYIAYEIDINNDLIKTIFSSHGDNNAPVFLVAMMMSVLGYENDVASSSAYKWNLVKVQGLWYHVDTLIKDEFLTSKKDDTTWSHSLPTGEKFAENRYDKNKSEELQAAYEITLLEQLLEKAEDTKLKADIVTAKEKIELIKLPDGIGEPIKIKTLLIKHRIDALEKLVELEVSITNYVDGFPSVDDTEINRTIGNFNKSISALQDGIELKAQYKTKLTLARDTREAIGKILDVEKTKLEEQKVKIDFAKNAIGEISDSLIKEKLSSKLNIIEAHSLINGQIFLVKTKIENVDADTDLSKTIAEAKTYIDQAKSDLKNIKDVAFKMTKDAEIKEIESLIIALNSVVKAEAPPLKITNVTSARKVVDKLDNKNIKEALTTRLKNIEDKIGLSVLLSNAIKAVEKAEKSMKQADIDSAKDPVEKIKDKPEAENLSARLAAILAINNMERSLASYLADHSEDSRTLLSNTITNAIEETKDLNIDKYTNRITVASKTREAIENIEIAKHDQTTNAAITINTAKTSITAISDSKIKNVLEKELNIIINQMDIISKLNKITTAIELAKTSIKSDNVLNNNIEAVKTCEEILKTLPSGKDKTAFQETIKELNSVVNAKKIVKAMEDKLEQKSLLLKDISTAENAVKNLEKDYTEAEPEIAPKQSLEDRIQSLKEGLEGLELDKAIAEVEKAEVSAKSDIKNLSKNIASAKKAVDQISIKKSEEKIELNNRIKALEGYVSTIKVLEIAEKTKNLKNRNSTQESLVDFVVLVRKIAEEDEENVYNDLILEIETRIGEVSEYLTGANQKQIDALAKVELAEVAMKVNTDPEDSLMQEAQSLVDLVIDNTYRGELQKRIDAIKLVKEAKLLVAKAEAYPVEKSVKDAEAILEKVDGSKYGAIVNDLSTKVIKLRNQLDLSKKVTEAIKLVDKATKSRAFGDISTAKLAVSFIKSAEDMYNTLSDILNELEISIKDVVGDQVAALKAAKDALDGEKGVAEGEIGLISRINQINLSILKIKADKEDKEGILKKSIQDAYEMVEGARIQILKANGAVARLKDKGTLLSEIDNAKKALDLSEDNLNVEEAIRLIAIASSSVNKPKSELDKPKATLDIAAARRAIDKITHNNNKDTKVTLLTTLKAFESKLVSDNDQELIDLAIEAVNNAADVFSKALKEDKVIVEQENIDKAIMSAKVAIIGISDSNKAAKDSLNRFINEIETMYKDEKAGVDNVVYITKAEAAVALAESSKLEGNIRSARLRVQMIKPINPESVLKISELTLRLDVLEGKGDKLPDPTKPDPSKPDATKPDAIKPDTTKPGATKPSGETNINKIPTNPLPVKDRDTGVSKPKWGETIELKKKSPIVSFPYY